jgi:hypothetical protein
VLKTDILANLGKVDGSVLADGLAADDIYENEGH